MNTKKISGILKNLPLHLVLLPVFFVLHGFLENFGFIPLTDALLLCLSYILLNLSVAVVTYIFFRNWTKAALITAFAMSFFFFFGALHDLLKGSPTLVHLSRYSVILPSIAVLVVLMAVILIKAKKILPRVTLFLNALLIIYLLVDIGTIIGKATLAPGKKLESAVLRSQQKPRFIYAHFYLPHAPYFYDKEGKRKDERIVYPEYLKKNIYSYLEHVQYTNTQIKNMITTIQQHNPSAVIVLLGDHGFRGTLRSPKEYSIHAFKNLNAVYLPDHDYSGLYDSISNVNQFRVILNNLFARQFPMLPDTSIFLVDKNPVDF